MQIRASRYPQLQSLCWNRPDDAVLTGPEALSLYEAYWRFVYPEEFSAEEMELLDTLIERFGNGVFMPKEYVYPPQK